MIRHPFTLEALSSELDSLLNRAVLTEIYRTDQEVLVLCWEKGREQWDMEIHLKDPFVSLFVRPHQGRPRVGAVDQLPLAIGSIVSRVVYAAPDRIVRIDCRRLNIVVHLFGGANANVLLVNPDEYVVDAIRERHERIAKPYELKAMQETLQVEGATITIQQWLSSLFPQFGKWYLAEVLHRCAVNATQLLASLDASQRERLQTTSQELVSTCKAAQTSYLSLDEDSQEVLSLIELQSCTLRQRFNTVREGLQWRVIHLYRTRKRMTLISTIGGRCRKEIQRLERALFHMRSAAAQSEKHRQLQYYGDILLSQPDVHRSGLSVLQLRGWHDDELKIVLEPTLNLAENAQRYYVKAKRSRESLRVNKERQPRYEQRLKDISSIVDELNTDLSEERLQQLQRQWIPTMNSQDKVQGPRDESLYRRFDLGGGYILYVGKSAQNNDELTMRFAKQNDLWFHARGVSGSHAVLRCTDSKKVPKNIVEASASIAAYYSKSRNAKYTPVVFTQRKYVRKPKGAAVGAVVLEREEVVMVEPKLPAGMTDNE